jgi:hypothetical protein
MNVNLKVMGEERHIQVFEKINICIMISKRGYSRGTIAGIYDRSLPQISEYTNEWMPKLGDVGADFSHLSLELNHSFITEEQCKAAFLRHMDEECNVTDYRAHKSSS